MKHIAPSAALLLVLLPAIARADLDAVKDLGVRMDDWSFDNGALLTAAIRAGKVNDAIDFPGGVVHHNTTIDLGHKVGLAFVGNGITHWISEAGHKADNSGNAATRFVYTGPPDQPAVIYRGVGLRWEGIVLQRGTRSGNNHIAPRDGSVGFQLTRFTPGNPSGKIWMPQAAFYGWDTAIDITGANNGDCSSVGWARFDDCNRCIRCDNSQAVGWDWGHLVVNGNCDAVFDIHYGGKYHVSTLTLNNPALVFHLRATNANSCYYKIDSLFIDNNARGWRLVQQDKPGWLRLRVDGHMSKQAAPGENPIALKPLVVEGKKFPQDIEIDMWWNGRRWPLHPPKPPVTIPPTTLELPPN